MDRKTRGSEPKVSDSDADNVIAAFAPEHVIRLTGLTMRQLAYWDKIGFFSPQYGAEGKRLPYSRIYSFRDVVGLRTLSLLRGRHGVPLPHLREVAEELSKYSKTPWADLKLRVWNRRVYFDEPETGQARDAVSGQYHLFPLADVIAEVKEEAEKLRERDKTKLGTFERHRYVAHNAPVIAGTRVRVETILHFVEDGYSVDEILREYPSLTKEDVQAVIDRGAAELAA